MKNALFVFGVGSVLVLAGGPVGCNKPAEPPPTVQAKATPTPTPKPAADVSIFDSKDINAEKLRDKANKAADSVGKYLDSQDPKLREKFQHLTDKVTAQLEKDKGHWREKLEAKRKELGPQIAKLRERLAQDGDATKDKLRAQLSELEKQSSTTDEKLAKLQAIGADAWKKFKAQLKEDEAKERTPPTDEGTTPSPTPTPEI